MSQLFRPGLSTLFAHGNISFMSQLFRPGLSTLFAHGNIPFVSQLFRPGLSTFFAHGNIPFVSQLFRPGLSTLFAHLRISLVNFFFLVIIFFGSGTKSRIFICGKNKVLEFINHKNLHFFGKATITMEESLLI